MTTRTPWAVARNVGLGTAASVPLVVGWILILERDQLWPGVVLLVLALVAYGWLEWLRRQK